MYFLYKIKLDFFQNITTVKRLESKFISAIVYYFWRHSCNLNVHHERGISIQNVTLCRLFFSLAETMYFASMWCDQSWWNSHFIRLTFSLPRFEFGSAIFIAWGGSLLDVLGGAMLAASCSKKKHLSKYPAATSSRSGAPACTKEYVWGLPPRNGTFTSPTMQTGLG